jgi:coatomer subunit beta
MSANKNAVYCTMILNSTNTAPPTQDELQSDLENSDVQIKTAAVKNLIMLMLQGEKFPRLLMTVIRFCINTQDHTLKKLLMLYWEIVPKHDSSGVLLPEMILVCNAIMMDLNHPNEYIRGSCLRFLCKLKDEEILAPLVPSVKQNLEHRHHYVRRHAVLAMFSIYQNVNPDLIPDAPQIIEEMLLNESDQSTRKNAFMMLFHCAQDRAIEFLRERLEDAGRYGDGFQLVILELTRKVVRDDPSKKAILVPALVAMLSSESPAVAYEAAWTLCSLSSAPTAIRAAANAYITLLTTHGDNNVKLIVLDRLSGCHWWCSSG